jgi:hypothetical protein
MALPPAMIFPVPATSADVVVFTGAACLRGWNLRNTSAVAPAALVIYDGTKNTGVNAADVDLLASESSREWFTGNGILLRTGAFLELGAGGVNGSLWLTPITDADDVAFAFGQSGPHFVHGGI